jgi:DNA (cytosine-5)-methyltransferase 1
MSKLSVASFFSGAGGLDLGFKSEEFEIIYASDIERGFCETLRMNKNKFGFSQTKIHCEDIREVQIDILPKKVDVVIGGPPCQSFSASGRRAGGAAGSLDLRGNLFESYKAVISKLKPSAFIFENVRGIFATNKGKDWERILKAFKSIGYNVDYRLLDAADYGIPQHRERVFLVGHNLKQPFLFPKPLFGPDSIDGRPHVSPKEAFSQLLLTKDDQRGTLFEGGKYSHLLPEVPDGQNYLFFTAKRGHPNPKFAYRSRFSDFLYKAHPDYPMKTIIASPGKYTGPLHWDNRYFSIAEYKAIQGFPQDYEIYGDRATQIKQIGNAVSPKIAQQLAKAINVQIFGSSDKVSLLDPDQSLSFDKRKGAKAAKTRRKHEMLAENGQAAIRIVCPKLHTTTRIEPIAEFNDGLENVTFTSKRSGKQLISAVFNESNQPVLEASLVVFDYPSGIKRKEIATVDVRLFGDEPAAMKLFWNAIDEWVRMATSFQSIFELYGHFTEPYPYFEVQSFKLQTENPFFKFAKYVTDFSHCSTYLSKNKLLHELGPIFDATEFDALANNLRSLRYDIRTKETNIAIPSNSYMIAYPFTLPMSKQMNFSIKKPRTNTEAESYVAEQRSQI